jgi:enoyl-[acyl-carrier-protein] reductase (NADH)
MYRHFADSPAAQNVTIEDVAQRLFFLCSGLAAKTAGEVLTWMRVQYPGNN